MDKPFLVISDLHLGAVPDSTESLFRGFLDAARGAASGLLINGDLFEFGMAYRSVIPRKHYRVLAKIADVVDSGVPVYFVGGNHDYPEWGGHVLRDAGVQLLEDHTVMEVAGRRALITHGDSVCRGRPQLERKLGRSRPIVGLLRWIHPDLLARVQPYTTTSRRQVQRQLAGLDGGPKSHAREIEAWARTALQRDPSLDLVIAGHSHLPAKIEMEPGRYYLNAGDWISHFTYLLLPKDASPELRRWIEGKSVEAAEPGE